ncbi:MULTISPECIES: hypothetical protein [Nocardioides]|uniref:DUF3017 domain-containing protein n=1 Tax=Nocardioides vastitatis TaxID=2568655 RepID=A0ABW0ZF56_9ACTN|nr:hypothetical protein [Nocardioides sp.]THJ00310.1 hypothetical protein E7Z54_11965 [Nocardioides sp.]
MARVQAMRGWWLPGIWSLFAVLTLARGRLVLGALLLCIAFILVEDKVGERWEERHPRLVRVADWTTRVLAGAAIAYLLWLLGANLYDA